MSLAGLYLLLWASVAVGTLGLALLLLAWRRTKPAPPAEDELSEPWGDC